MEIVSVVVKAKCFERNEQIKGSEVRRPIPGYKSPWKHWHFHILSFGKLYSTPEHLSCRWQRFEILNAIFYWEPFNHFVSEGRVRYWVPRLLFCDSCEAKFSKEECFFIGVSPFHMLQSATLTGRRWKEKRKSLKKKTRTKVLEEKVAGN